MLNRKIMAVGAVLAVAVSILANVSTPGLAWADGPYLDDATASKATFPSVSDTGNVLVAFENGDVRSPYVVGLLWNGSDQPPESDSEGDKD